MSYSTITFGAGDIFESREFIRAYMERIPAEKYSYAHGKSPRFFADISELQMIKVEEWMPMRTDVAYINNENLIVNTWIGRDESGKYVLPGIGCTIEKLYEMHSDMLKKLQLSPLEKPIIEYAPKVSWERFYTQPVDKWIEEHPDRKVLISNGPVHSNQAENFNFVEPIKELADHYKFITFIITQPADIKFPNVFYSGDIVNSKDKFDLYEVGYLSLACDTFIGRNSGPHVFAQNYDNWQNLSKASLSFTYTAIGSHNFYTPIVKMKRFWCGRTDPKSVFEACCKVIER